MIRCAVFAVTMSLVAVTTAGAQDTGNAESLERLRAKLDRPASALNLQPRTPDFSVHIEKRRPMQDIFDVPPWATDPVGWQPPAVGFDLLSVFRYAAKSVADAKRGRDQRLAREEVERAIVDYCAARAAEEPAVQMCSTSAAIR